MLPAESGITYALGLLGERRTFDGGPERLPAGGILAGMFFSSPASKSPLERGGPLAVGSVLSEIALRTRPRQAALRLSICSCSSRRMVFKTFYDWRGEGVFPRVASLTSPDDPPGITSAGIFRRITSWDALLSITSRWSRPCVPAQS
jgi:hypothetical protein